MMGMETTNNNYAPLITFNRGKDRLKVLTAKNFINNFLKTERSGMVKYKEMYKKYVEELRNLSPLIQPLSDIGFKQLIESMGFKVKYYNSILYNPEILGLSYASNPNPNRIFEGIPFSYLKRRGVSFEDFQNITQMMFLGRESYVNGIRDNNDFEVKADKEEQIIKTDDNGQDEFDKKVKEVEMFSSVVEESEQNKNDNVKDQEEVTENNQNASETDTKVLSFDEEERKIYNDFLKAKIDYEIATQEYQFALGEFNIAKFKLMQKKLNEGKINFNEIKEIMK